MLCVSHCLFKKNLESKDQSVKSVYDLCQVLENGEGPQIRERFETTALARAGAPGWWGAREVRGGAGRWICSIGTSNDKVNSK